MSTFYSDLGTTQNASTGVHSRITDSRLSDAKLKQLLATYTLTSGTDEAANDTIRLCRLIPGALYFPAMGFAIAESGSFTYFEFDLGVEYDDGTTADLDKFVDGMPLMDGARSDFLPSGGGWVFRNAELTTVGGAATEAFTLTGVAATDRVTATITDEGGNNDCYVIAAVPTANTVTFRFNEDPTSGSIIQTRVERTAVQTATMVTPAQALDLPGWLTLDIKAISGPIAGKKLVFALPFLGI